MDRSQAEILLARLVAAYPRERLEEANIELYAERLERLRDFETAYRAVDLLIDGSPRFPTVAEIRTAYKRERRDQPALPLPPMTEAERQENLRMAREMARRVGRPL